MRNLRLYFVCFYTLLKPLLPCKEGMTAFLLTLIKNIEKCECK